MTEQPMFQCSLESQQLGDYLVKHAAKQDFDTVLSYDELSRIAGCDVTNGKRHVLDTARRIAQRSEQRAVYGPVRGVGIKLLLPRERVATNETTLQSIRRKATKGLKCAATVEYEQLTDDEKVRHNMNSSLLGVMRLATGKPMQKKLEGAVVEAQKKITVQTMAKLFGG